MDANNRNESAIRQRDAKLARRLGEALDELNPHGSATPCPDAEVIAAYSQQALGADELAQCENHFATCGRCRNILKVLAAASDAPLAETEVAQLGQRVSTVRAPVEITAGATKHSRSKAAAWSTRWLAPALGVAAVLTVWFVMRPPWRAMDRSGSPTLIAQAPREEMPEFAPLTADQAQKAAPTPETSPAKTTAPNASLESSASDKLKSRDELQEASPSAGLEKKFSNEKKESATILGENKAKALGAPSPVAPSLGEPPQAAVSSATNSAAPLPRARAQIDSAASSSPFPATPNPASADATQSAGKSVRATGSAPADGGINNPAATPMRQQPAPSSTVDGRQFKAVLGAITGPLSTSMLTRSSGRTAWRVGPAGAIERSTDAGKIWVKQKSPSKENWLAGEVVSDSVCWIAGSNGAIARTTDGEHWVRIAPPPQIVAKNGKLPDWSDIAAQDAQSATITANDGTKFATTDGGKTWQQQ
jgi:hypothetical protein